MFWSGHVRAGQVTFIRPWSLSLTCRSRSSLAPCCVWNVLDSSRSRSPPAGRTTAGHTWARRPGALWICPTMRGKTESSARAMEVNFITLTSISMLAKANLRCAKGSCLSSRKAETFPIDAGELLDYFCLVNGATQSIRNPIRNLVFLMRLRSRRAAAEDWQVLF